MTTQDPASAHASYHVLPGRPAGGEQEFGEQEFIVSTADGVRLAKPSEDPRGRGGSLQHWYYKKGADPYPDLVAAIGARGMACGAWPPVGVCVTTDTYADVMTDSTDHVTGRVLVLPRSERWREATSTALLGPWCDPLWQTGHLPTAALGALRAEARTLHRHLVPLWRRGTRHGRVLSLDADLGGLSLYDLVATDVGLLVNTVGGVFEDERLNRVLRGLDPAERAVVFAYAEGEGTTWTEAATAAGVPEPEAFGERVRRKVHRLAAEQRRRAAQRRSSSSAA
ncbi:hypothetical protein ACH4ZX_39605 [Streptomyces sp. NPDC020490]|uniref:hypothetical protein n=1 Tax=Streptomyces sp. NPDC020490 TaxID=3365078 RepID=UPI0037943C7B